jgi:hypothetical protein
MHPNILTAITKRIQLVIVWCDVDSNANTKAEAEAEADIVNNSIVSQEVGRGEREDEK